MVFLLAVVGVMVWIGAALIISAFGGAGADLGERLARFHRPWIADEVQEWLKDQ